MPSTSPATLTQVSDGALGRLEPLHRHGDLSIQVVSEQPLAGARFGDPAADHPRLVVALASRTPVFEAEMGPTLRFSGAVVAGDFSFVPAGHQLRGHYRGASLRYAVVEASRERWESVLSRLGGGVRQPLLMAHDDFVLALVRQLVQPVQDSLVAEATVETLLLHLGQRLAHRPAPQVSAADNRLVKLRDWLDGHLDRPVRVAELAHAAGLTAGELTILLRMHEGTSPARYVQARRLDRARQLLAHSPKGLAEIAADCGFSSQSHFTRAFARAHGGQSPGRYRREFRFAI